MMNPNNLLMDKRLAGGNAFRTQHQLSMRQGSSREICDEGEPCGDESVWMKLDSALQSAGGEV
jgi:hypothetical protein